MPLDATARPTRVETRALTGTFDRPTLILDPEAVRLRYRALSAGLGEASVYYAVKANPDPAVLAVLAEEGASFDCASWGEVALCLEAGVPGPRLSFGNTVKKADHIARAHEAGVPIYAADCAEEVDKIAAHAPGAGVYVRLLVETSPADYPLSRKFGCPAWGLEALLDHVAARGLRPLGISFHIGSQVRRSDMWGPTLRMLAEAWHAAREAHDLTLLNVGGGFPAFYGQPMEAPRDYAAAVMSEVRAAFGDAPRIMAEPGRGLVAEAGAIACEVVQASTRGRIGAPRWVYLDIGQFSGLVETQGEAIRYRFLTAKDGGLLVPCILAGPSCDSADILYEKSPVDLPEALEAGDRVVIRNTGAYTSSYSSVGFNGFPPLAVEVLP